MIQTKNSTYIIAEYIWLDGNTPKKVRSKTKIIDITNKILNYSSEIKPGMLPDWNYDGSSTGQAETNDSEIILKPKNVFSDPFDGDILVLCGTYDTKGNPIYSNTRSLLENTIQKDKNTWYGFEQEYIMYDKKTHRPLGWPRGQDAYPKEQGDYYCGVGSEHVVGREITEEHYQKCLKAGIKISGVNAEVALGQWEYQVGPVTALDGSDQLWVSRYILYRLGEKYNVSMNIDPKPINSIHWNGSGMHVNFSTEQMRDKDNIKSGKSMILIEEACDRLKQTHESHLEVYGENNENRLTGTNETADYKTFSWGYGDRTASIRIPNSVKDKKAGYLEDRRPASNGDPYLIVEKLISTIC